MARNYAALPHEYEQEMRKLSDEDFGRLVRALLFYSATGEDVEPEGNGAFYWERVKMQEDRFQASYEETVTFNKERAKKAAAARWNKGGEDPSMLEHAQASFSNAQNAINKTKTETETETESKTKLCPSSEGGVYKAPLPSQLSPGAQRLMDKLEESRRRLAAIRAEAEESYSYPGL